MPVKPGELEGAPIQATAAAPLRRPHASAPSTSAAPTGLARSPSPPAARRPRRAAPGGRAAARVARPPGEREHLHLPRADHAAEVDHRAEGRARRRDLARRRLVEAAREHRRAGELLPGGRGGRAVEDAGRAARAHAAPDARDAGPGLRRRDPDAVALPRRPRRPPGTHRLVRGTAAAARAGVPGAAAEAGPARRRVHEVDLGPGGRAGARARAVAAARTCARRASSSLAVAGRRRVPRVPGLLAKPPSPAPARPSPPARARARRAAHDRGARRAAGGAAPRPRSPRRSRSPSRRCPGRPSS